MNSQYGMVFYPNSIVFRDKEKVLVRLTEAGFLGDKFSLQYEGQKEKHTGYLLADNFLKLITFLGCSPHMTVLPPEKESDWSHFCHIEIQQFQSPCYFKGLDNSRCSCPQCKSRVTKVLPDMAQWTADTMSLVCPKCGQTTRLEDLNWRHSAGFGVFFIVIHSVYPSEAIPTQKLMKLLSPESLEDWDYFYFER